ncbi:MAG: DUF3108 domain-containing protein [Gemmatimonadota bacterium]|nr:DUF3108 domain-containing protein [Gemmatimonadota bacterium]
MAARAQEREILMRDSLSVMRGNAGVVPLWIGEELRYKVKYGIIGVGEGRMGVARLDTINGWTTYVAEMHIKGLGMDQTSYSWIDTEKLFSRRFVKEEEDRPREYDFLPEERLVHQIEHLDSTWSIETSEPLDDIAFVYLARTLPLKVGQIYEYNRYFKEERNPIILKVLRRDKRKVGAGEFNTIVVQPIIPKSSLFAEGGNAEIHLSDDERRLMVYMKVDGPVLPFNFTLHLEEFREGRALGDDGDGEEQGDKEDDSGKSSVGNPPRAHRPDPPN